LDSGQARDLSGLLGRARIDSDIGRYPDSVIVARICKEFRIEAP